MNKKKYGVVEGFFSRPLSIWTQQEREDIIRLIAENRNRINYYYYCSKQDPYVVGKCDRILPQWYKNEIKRTNELCKGLGINYCFGFNPEFSICKLKCDYQRYLSKIFERIDQLISTGCRNISLLYDDISELYDMADNKKISNENVVAELLVRIANDVYDKYRNVLESYIFCFYDYYFTSETVLTREIKKKLNPAIIVVWTGGARFVRKARNEDYQRVRLLLGQDKKILYWSNYPSNNCECNLGVFHIGAYNNPQIEVFEGVDGILVNPMREAYSNIPVLTTFKDYLRDPYRYDRTTALKKSFRSRFSKSWKDVYMVSRYFSYPNIVDKRKFGLSFLRENDNSKVGAMVSRFISVCQRACEYKEKLSRNQLAYKYLDTIQNMLEESRSFAKLCDCLLDEVPVSFDLFRSADVFPTYLKVDRYFVEVMAIVMGKIDVYKEFVDSKDMSEFAYAAKRLLRIRDKYLGRKKLSMSKSDSQFLLSEMKRVVMKERKLFYSCVVDAGIDSGKKIRLLVLRKNVNRYGIDKNKAFNYVTVG